MRTRRWTALGTIACTISITTAGSGRPIWTCCWLRCIAPPRRSSGVTADAETSEASEETSPRPSDEALETSEILLAIDGLFARDPLSEVG